MIKRLLKFVILPFIVLIVALIVWGRFNQGIGLGNGYRLVEVRSDKVHIIKNDQMVVLPSIVDYQENSQFIAGLRFPAINMVCEHSYAIILNLKKEKYFLLNKESGDLKHFDNRLEFEKKLAEISALDSVPFDYSKFEIIREEYSKLYANSDEIGTNTCKPYLVGTLEYEVYKDPSNN